MVVEAITLTGDIDNIDEGMEKVNELINELLDTDYKLTAIVTHSAAVVCHTGEVVYNF